MYIGIDVGGTNLVAGLVDENGKILHKASCPVDKSMTAEELTRQLAKLSLQAAKEADCPLSEIQAAGVGLPGLVSNKTGMVIKTTNMPFYNTPFREFFQEDLKIPVYLGNDADCAAVGEYWAGSAKGFDPALVITLGTGIGSGMVRGGKLYIGHGGAGMEAGHMIIHPNGVRCGCGNLGCWEQYGSATALVRLTREEMEYNRDSMLWQLCDGDTRKLEGRTTFQAVREGDATARKALDRYLEGLSMGLINLVNVLFPEIVCLGGGISNADDDLLLNPLRELVHRGSFDKDHLPRIERASLGNDAGVVGAAMLCNMF